MKYLSFMILVLSYNAFANTKVITLNDVAKNVKETNFTVLENAQRVYQAKETITFSKRNLLPRLNFWSLIKIPIDPLASLDIIQDVAPFLVPSNWFRVSQNKLFHLAQKEQYRALWANEVMTAKLLYINTLRDIDFLNILKTQKSQIEELVAIAASRSATGDIAPQVLNFLQIRELELEEDIRSLNTIIAQEEKSLTFLMGLKQEESIELEEIVLPDVEDLQKISFDTFIFRALDNAPEINQFEYIKNSLRYIRGEAYFSFMGASTTARSAGGGMFDSIPIQDGLGFGMGSTLRIASSQANVLNLNMIATKEVIKKNLYNLVSNFNSYVENVDNQTTRFKLAQDNHTIIRTQLVLGADLDPLQILTSIENLFDASVSLTNYKYEIVTTMEKLERSIFNGDYSKKEGMLESLLERKNI